ncbi:MAG: DUF2752 domain-containing protein [Synechococcus sp. ELA619]
MARIAFLERIRQSGYLVPAALTGYLWLKGGWPELPGLSCPLRALTGIPCPTCYLTRATCVSLRGDWLHALQLHAFGPLVAAALLIWSVQAIRRRRFLPKELKAWHLVAFTFGLVAYWAIRMGLSHGLGMQTLPSG